MSQRRIDIDPNTGLLRVSFEYDPDLVQTVKSLPQRRWDPRVRAWFIPPQHLKRVWDTLASLHFNLSDDVRALGEQQGVDLPPPVTGLHAPEAFSEQLDHSLQRVSLADLNQRVQDALRTSFPGTVWVIGELSEWRLGRGRTIYFVLIEQDPQRQKTVARASAILFPNARARIEETLKSVGGAVALSDGVQVCLEARVELFAPSGRYQLIIEGIDPGYTLGRLTQKRDMILGRLEALGLLGLNRTVPISPLPLRVGVITSRDSHAYSDFINELSLSQFGFEVQVYNARMQGHFLEQTVLAGLEHFRAPGRSGDRGVDVVAIVRGGGARTDLAWFDTLKLAVTVAEYPRPVLVGIGHHRDVSVLDDVARSFKTPTAVARFLNTQVSAVVELLDELQERIRAAATPKFVQQKAQLRFTAQQLVRESRHRLGDGHKTLRHCADQLATIAGGHVRASQQELERVRTQLPRASERRLELATAKLGYIADNTLSQGRLLRETRRQRGAIETLKQRLDDATARTLERERTRLEHTHVRCSNLDPRRLLERGYTIVHAIDEGNQTRLIRHSASLDDNALLRFTFADGAITRRLSPALPDNTGKDPAQEPS